MQGSSGLTVHSKAIDLVAVVYGITEHFPKHELFGLTSQLRRAVVSVPANIAEGQARIHRREFLHHLSMARGSLAEVETLLLVAVRLNYVQSDDLRTVHVQAKEVARMLAGLIRSLDGESRPLHAR
jgi:four helix bundle protein